MSICHYQFPFKTFLVLQIAKSSQEVVQYLFIAITQMAVFSFGKNILSILFQFKKDKTCLHTILIKNAFVSRVTAVSSYKADEDDSWVSWSLH